VVGQSVARAASSGPKVSTQLNEETSSGTGSDVDAAGGKYHVLMELGRGGTAVVSAGIARGIGGFSKLVVLKNIKEDFLTDRETVKMFVNEARLSARMNHPNIVQVYEVFRQNKLPVIVMEYLDGQSLAKIHARAFRDPDYTVDMAVVILSKVLAGLHYAHTLTDYDGTPLQIVHRDVSPHNVMLTYDGQVKLVDFGIAKLSSSTQDTKTGVIKGKIGYMAPEQLDGNSLDHRGDVFAVGVMLWEAIARRRLWGSRSDAEIVRCLIVDDIPALKAVVADVDPELERICMKALATQPEYRYSSAAEFQSDLETFLAKRGVSVGQQAIAELVCKTCADLRASSQALLKAELAKFAAAAPGWDDALQAFDNMRTPIPEASTPATKPNRSVLYIASALIALATGMGVFAWLTMSSEPPPAAVVTPEPVVPIPVAIEPAPRKVQLAVSVTPGHAALYLDGRRLSSAPISESLVADTTEHELRAEAEGFETLTERVRLDTDLNLKLTMKASPAPEPPDNGRPQPRATGRKRPPRRGPTQSATTTPTPAPPTPTPAGPDCNPPYYIGSDGLKHYRRECL
jgi:eukaryotic-like serine/threonine-protein kinase